MTDRDGPCCFVCGSPETCPHREPELVCGAAEPSEAPLPPKRPAAREIATEREMVRFANRKR